MDVIIELLILFHISLQVCRYEKFTQQKDLITKIMTDIGEEVTTEFEQDVVIEDPECFVLSDGNMAQLTDMLDKVNIVVEQCKRARS